MNEQIALLKPGNPMRWDCDERGCFNRLCRPKIEQFSDCFPGRICMGDVDGLVEVNGRLMFLEWKRAGIDIQPGQAMLYGALAKRGDFVIAVRGNAETMEVADYCWFFGLTRSPWRAGDLRRVKLLIRRWVTFASFGNPRFFDLPGETA